MTKENKRIDNEVIDNLLKDSEDLIGENGLLKELTKRLLERAMAAEMTEHGGMSGMMRRGGAAGTRATASRGRR